MSNQGWIKLHRQLRDNPIYKSSTALHCWIECLLRAIHTDESFFLKRQKRHLKPGQFCMGRDEFGLSVGISSSTAWFWINQFNVDRMIDIKTSSVGTVVTILKWKDYQGLDSEVDSGKTADEQRMNTIKNDKNVENEDKRIISKDITKPIGFDSRKVGMDVFASKGNAAVSSVITRLEQHLGAKLDGSVRNNRNFASHLLKKYTHEQIEAIFKALPLSKFWAGKITSTQSLYNHASQIINSLQDQGGKFADLSYVN